MERLLDPALAGARSAGAIEYGNVVPYVLERSGLVASLPTTHDDYGFSVESVGLPVGVPLDGAPTAAEVAPELDPFV